MKLPIPDWISSRVILRANVVHVEFDLLLAMEEVVVEDAVVLGVQTGGDGGPRRKADGGKDGLDVLGMSSFLDELVQVGHF
jgi:hypothetical protein